MKILIRCVIVRLEPAGSRFTTCSLAGHVVRLPQREISTTILLQEIHGTKLAATLSICHFCNLVYVTSLTLLS